MRTALTLDDDVVALLEQERRKRKAKLRVLRPALAAVLVLAGAGCVGAKAPASAPGSQPPAAAFGLPARLNVGQSVRYADGLLVRLDEIEDSRCPADAVCVWQGELSPHLRLAGGSVATPHELQLGTVRALEGTFGSYRIALREATAVSATIVVTHRDAGAGPEGDSTCRRTGCSGEICSDQKVSSACLYRPEYACYQNAACERQADGKCGWTETPALTGCLAAATGADP